MGAWPEGSVGGTANGRLGTTRATERACALGKGSWGTLSAGLLLFALSGPYGTEGIGLPATQCDLAVSRAGVARSWIHDPSGGCVVDDDGMGHWNKSARSAAVASSSRLGSMMAPPEAVLGANGSERLQIDSIACGLESAAVLSAAAAVLRYDQNFALAFAACRHLHESLPA